MSRKRKPRSWWAARRIWAVAFRQVVLCVEYSYHGLPIAAHNSLPRSFPRGATLLQLEAEVSAMIQKQQARRVAGAVSSEVAVCAMATQMPLVFDYLTQTQYADGSPRKPSSLLLFNDGGLLKLMLRDQDAGLCCWVAGESLEAVWAALEAALGDPEHEWRVDRQATGQKATRVKR